MADGSRRLPLIAITIGDIYGIGPEIILKCLTDSSLFDICIPIVYGPLDVVKHYHALLQTHLTLHPIGEIAEAIESVLNVLSMREDEFHTDSIGASYKAAGEISLETITRACQDCMHGHIHGLVTAPISKESIHKAGSTFTGHTDMLAAFTGTQDVLMILASTHMKIGLVTVHIPLRDVAAEVTMEKVVNTIQVAHDSLIHDFGITQPGIAVLGLNPHAGDGGILGREEIDIVIPAIEYSKERKIDVHGPFAADGFFSTHQKERFDMIIAMYHDQGLIPLKMQSRGFGVNFTAGLPIVRTSPDHGTAFTIAGKLSADASSMREAILMALDIIQMRSTRARIHSA